MMIASNTRRKKKNIFFAKQKILFKSLCFSLILIISFSAFIPVGKQESQIDLPNYSGPIFKTAPFKLEQECSQLLKTVQTISKQPKLHTGIFLAEPNTGKYLSLFGQETFSAASMIKVPILVKLLSAMDKDEIELDEELILTKELMGGGSGYLQWRPENSKVALKEAMESMIIFSDNTATNLIINRLGGKTVCNKEFKKWGLSQTKINNWLPDLDGTNTTSPYDLVQILSRVDSGDLLSPRSRTLMLAIMEKTRTRTLLPMGLPQGIHISHKTGDIGSLVGDCGIISGENGHRYIVAIEIARPHNDRRANDLVRKLSKHIYENIVTAKKLTQPN